MDRLQKAIAHSGYCSRRAAEKLIEAGKVKVNNQVVKELGYKVNSDDIIEVEGHRLKKEKKEYFLLYKPKGVISAASDDKGRTTVVDLLEYAKTRIYPVGRLDYDTTGALLLTNDGDFAHKMMHPTNEVKKTYLAFVSGIIEPEQIKKLEQGVEIDGYKTAKAKAKILEKDFKNKNSKVQLIISEGKNHQVKKMFEAVGLRVRKLHRQKYGHLNLNGLTPGEYRKLNKNEITDLLTMAEYK